MLPICGGFRLKGREGVGMRSEVYLQLRKARRDVLLVNGMYHEKARAFRVMKLGWTDGKERCLAWQYGEKWKCFEVAELSEVSLGGPAPELDLDRGKPPVCVQVVDEEDDE